MLKKHFEEVLGVEIILSWRGEFALKDLRRLKVRREGIEERVK
ncbi:hypothetical protein HS7_14830 [Sulfolobales archaeon HS-7]|nr:hypothetical protein HS7_14830 [Sulfolobales archaeon HS-7]